MGNVNKKKNMCLFIIVSFTANVSHLYSYNLHTTQLILHLILYQISKWTNYFDFFLDIYRSSWIVSDVFKIKA